MHPRSDWGSLWTPLVGVYGRLFPYCTRPNGKQKSFLILQAQQEADALSVLTLTALARFFDWLIYFPRIPLLRSNTSPAQLCFDCNYRDRPKTFTQTALASPPDGCLSFPLKSHHPCDAVSALQALAAGQHPPDHGLIQASGKLRVAVLAGQSCKEMVV
eukprot:1161678-Pelagomonas_calceolata.AAC.4